jgi:hypothetical protein
MLNEELELAHLRAFFNARQVDPERREALLRAARGEMIAALEDILRGGLDTAIQAGVDKRSAEFIDELRPRPGAFELTTDSGNTDFSVPPYPMLTNLLQNAKPMADGSGVYKVIPVGGASERKPVYTSIIDVQRARYAQQLEMAAKRRNNKSNNPKFRTATSKQPITMWVQPKQDKDFTETLEGINSDMKVSGHDIILGIVRKYEDMA